MIKQTKIRSLIEANANTAIGFITSTLTWHYLVPIIWSELKPHANWSMSFGVTMLFTVISILRNYIVRRIFNKME